MNPGRELDALIAEKVMGIPMEIHPKPYSIDITAAWEVVNKLTGEGRSFGLMTMVNGYDNKKCWSASFETDYDWEYLAKSSDTVTHAICLAALKVMK